MYGDQMLGQREWCRKYLCLFDFNHWHYHNHEIEGIMKYLKLEKNVA